VERSRHRRALIGAAICAWFAWSFLAGGGVARAADPAAAGTPEAVEALIQRGIQLRKSGDDRGALPELRKAYELGPAPRTAAQLGLVEQALGRWDEAEVHIAESLRATNDPWVKKNRATLEKALTIVRDHVASVQISGDPEGAEVFVNGRRVGTLPLKEPVRVIAGEVDIELRAEGYKRSFQKIGIEAFQFRALVIRLEKPDEKTAVRAPSPAGGGAAAAGGGAAGGSGAGADKPDAEGPPAGEAPPARRSLRPLVGWIGAGAGGVTAAVGLVMALAGQSKMDEALDQAERANMTGDAALYMSASANFSDGSSQRTTGRVLLVVGAVVAAGGVVLALTAPRPEPQPGATSVAGHHVSPWLAPGAGGQLAAGGLVWAGSF
jgi:hypothetical protein